jgi:kanamycin nucleotidyltransferase
MTHEDRLAVARDLAQRILAKYGDAVLGIAIYGSVARGVDTSYSDIELKVITSDSVDEHDVEYVHRSGMKIEINYEHAENYLHRAGSVDTDWPIWAGQYRQQVVLFERENFFAQARQAVGSLKDKDFRAAQAQLIAEDLYELVQKIRGAWEHHHEENLRWWAGRFLWFSIMWLGLANREYFTSGNTVWEEVRKFAILPKDFESHLRALAGFKPSSVGEIYRAVEGLWTEIQRLADEQGVVWQSDEWLV